MSKTLSQIQLLVREYTKTDEISLTVDPGISLFNSSYRRICTLFKWPELRVTLSDDTVTTSTSTNLYDWITENVIDGGDASTTVYASEVDDGDASVQYESEVDGGDASASTPTIFFDIVAVEVGNDASSTIMELLYQPRTETEWAETDRDAAGVPVYYIRRNVSGVDKIELRPDPGYNGGKIQIVGYVEPDELTVGSDTTVLSKIGDDALARLIAAEYFFKNGNTQKGEEQLAQIPRLLGALKEEKTTMERSDG